MIPNLTWAAAGNWDTYVAAEDQWGLAVLTATDTVTLVGTEGTSNLTGSITVSDTVSIQTPEVVSALAITTWMNAVDTLSLSFGDLAETPSVNLDRVDTLGVTVSGSSLLEIILCLDAFDDCALSTSDSFTELFKKLWEEARPVAGVWGEAVETSTTWSKTPSGAGAWAKADLVSDIWAKEGAQEDLWASDEGIHGL